MWTQHDSLAWAAWLGNVRTGDQRYSTDWWRCRVQPLAAYLLVVQPARHWPPPSSTPVTLRAPSPAAPGSCSSPRLWTHAGGMAERKRGISLYHQAWCGNAINASPGIVWEPLKEKNTLTWNSSGNTKPKRVELVHKSWSIKKKILKTKKKKNKVGNDSSNLPPKP